jgi:hypothetical protein
LIARNFNLAAAIKLISEALEWREKRQPDTIEPDHVLSHESETGKIYWAGFDKWDRSVLVFDSSVQNTKNADSQMRFLAWNLEFAFRVMKPCVDKYLVFMHMGTVEKATFSIFNSPSLAVTRETIKILCNCYPERLGHCIIYQPPAYFKIVFNSVKFLVDKKTVSKMIFISGDVSSGTENDTLMQNLVGSNWKELSGAEQPVVQQGCSPGFNHATYWKNILRIHADLSRSTNTLDTSIDSSIVPAGESPRDIELIELRDRPSSCSGAIFLFVIVYICADLIFFTLPCDRGICIALYIFIYNGVLYDFIHNMARNISSILST